VARDVSVDPSSDDCFEIAREWLHDCFWNHGCGTKRGPLPTRVLALGEDNENIFLYESEGEKEDYAALSHCWGTAMPITTTIATLEQRKHGIPFSELPKTFQDAVIIARRLSVSYLWIDSLCIVQDSESDWQKEAAQMDRVFHGAYFTIAAQGSNDPHGGCFVAGDYRLSKAVSIECPGPGGAKGYVRVRQQGFRPPAHADGLAHILAGLPAKPSRLSTRGWVLQERLLSRRTLHYTPTELVWECAAGLQCECQVVPEVSDTSFKKMYMMETTNDHSLSMASKGQPDYPEFLLQRRQDIRERNPVLGLNWPVLIENFTQLQLTYQSDRLPALSGLAAGMKRGTADVSSTDTYLFGLWKHDLVGGLLWQGGLSNLGTPPTVHKRQPDKYAPSWSWASITGPIMYSEEVRAEDNHDEKKRQRYPNFQILETTCSLGGLNPYGAGSGSLTVLGGMVHVRIAHVEPRTEYSSKSFIAASTKAAKSTKCPWDFFQPDVRGDGYEVSDGDDCFFLIVTYVRPTGWAGHHSGKPIGLILKQCGSSGSCFKRVGYLRGQQSGLIQWEEVAEPMVVVLE
jgi:hypothetical protein